MHEDAPRILLGKAWKVAGIFKLMIFFNEKICIIVNLRE
jgi:hypothetical protein